MAPMLVLCLSLPNAPSAAHGIALAAVQATLKYLCLNAKQMPQANGLPNRASTAVWQQLQPTNVHEETSWLRLPEREPRNACRNATSSPVGSQLSQRLHPLAHAYFSSDSFASVRPAELVQQPQRSVCRLHQLSPQNASQSPVGRPPNSQP